MKWLKTVLTYIAFIIIMLVLTFASFAIITYLQEKIFIKGEYIMWVSKSPYNKIIFLFEIYIIAAGAYIFKKIKVDGIVCWIIPFARVYKKLFLIINIVLLYVTLVNVAVIKEDRIIDYSTLKPQGEVITFNQVKKIESGFFNKRRYEGDFYYYIYLDNGRKMNLSLDMGGVYDENRETYSQIEIIDKILVDMGITKESSMKNFHLNSLDKVYRQRFKRIVNNR